MSDRELIELAYEGRKRAYVPYSGFRVGAALLAKSGAVYLGCNIENASYTPTNCAERTAFFKAVSEGEREFEAIAIVGGPGEQRTGNLCSPCGVCRQVMMEFCQPKSFRVLLEDRGEVRAFYLEELLPLGFGPDNLAELPALGAGADNLGELLPLGVGADNLAELPPLGFGVDNLAELPALEVGADSFKEGATG